VLPVERFFRQIGLLLAWRWREILSFGGWLVFGLLLSGVCSFFGGLVVINNLSYLLGYF